MDSLDLISTKKEEHFTIKNNNNSGKVLLKYIIILLVLLFISNISISYFIFGLSKKVITRNMNFESNSINNIVQKYIQAQNEFCNYPGKYYNNQFEEL